MKLKLTRILHFVSMVAMALSLLSIFIGPLKDRAYIGELVFLGFLILGAYLDYNLWRCPNCGFHLGSMKKIPDHCPHCKSFINKNQKIDPKQNRKIQEEWMKKEDK